MDALRREGIPFVSVLADPTYGGVSASYAMQADVRIAVGSARIGFAGPAVILNTMFEMDQSKFDAACPENFQVQGRPQSNIGSHRLLLQARHIFVLYEVW